MRVGCPSGLSTSGMLRVSGFPYSRFDPSWARGLWRLPRPRTARWHLRGPAGSGLPTRGRDGTGRTSPAPRRRRDPLSVAGPLLLLSSRRRGRLPGRGLAGGLLRAGGGARAGGWGSRAPGAGHPEARADLPGCGGDAGAPPGPRRAVVTGGQRRRRGRGCAESGSRRLQPSRRELRRAEIGHVRASGGADLSPLCLGFFGCSRTSALERR